MRIIFTGGGTAGHINPAIGVAQALTDKDEVLFVGRAGGKENRLIEKEGFALRELNVHGLERKLSLKNLKLPFEIMKSIKEAKKLIDEFAPDVIFGTGGYASLPSLLAGISKKIPTVIHESNITPGLVTKMLQKRCDAVFINLEESREYYSKKANVEAVGIPLRRGFYATDRSEARGSLGLKGSDILIVSFGGSGGSGKMNESIIELMKSYSVGKGRIKHIHAVGERYFERAKSENEKLCAGYCGCKIVPYIDDMPTYLFAADIVISRCGAITLAEIGSVGVASILIPSPNVTDDHQRKNARIFQKHNAAIMIEESELNDRVLLDAVKSLENSEEQRIKLGRNASALFPTNSAEKILKELKYLIKRA